MGRYIEGNILKHVTFSKCFVLLLIFINGIYAQNKVSFIVLGDWGRDGTFNQKEVAEQMGIYGETLGISFVVTTGDNFYPDGVNSVDSPQWQTSFENIYTAPSLQKRWYVTLGNHDYHQNPQPEIDYTQRSTRWYLPKRYYSEVIKIDDTTESLFLFIDTTPFVTKYYSGGHSDASEQDYMKQLGWIDSVLANTPADWRFIAGHHPVITGGEHGNTKELVEYLKPLLEKRKVNAYFSGHDHDMQHLRSEGVNYFGSGAGSATRKCKATEHTLFQQGELSGFLAVTLSAAEMKCTFIDYKGNEIYNTLINNK